MTPLRTHSYDLDAGGARLHCLEAGDGADVVVLLHGGPGASLDYLRPALDALANEKRRLFYYDQRGGGKSSLAPAEPAAPWQTHVADLERVRGHLGVEKLTLVGYSWGGLLALLYAVEYSTCIDRLALVSPAPTHEAARLEMKLRLDERGQSPQVATFKAELKDRIGQGDKRARFAVAVAGYFSDPHRALELTPFLVRQTASDAVWQSLSGYDLRAELSKLSVRALVAHGTDDPIPIESARETAALIGADFVELPGGHVPYIEAADKLIPAIKEFLDEN